MVFDVRFALPGFVVLILLLATIPVLIAVSGWLYQELRQTRARLRRWQLTLAPLPPPARGEVAYRTFISSVSHQTSNALQAILAALSNLRELVDQHEDEHPVPALPDALRYLAQIELETHRLLELTAKLRTLAQLEMDDAPISVQPVQLRSVIADVIMGTAAHAAHQGIELIYHGPSRPPRVLADRSLITLALQNLVDNSLKYARPESREITIGLTDTVEHVCVSVADDGAGIARALLPHVFDGAYRAPDPRLRRQAGSGLGLTIVRRIVERHGGQLELQSTYGAGTLVSFRLPKSSPDATV